MKQVFSNLSDVSQEKRAALTTKNAKRSKVDDDSEFTGSKKG